MMSFRNRVVILGSITIVLAAALVIGIALSVQTRGTAAASKRVFPSLHVKAVDDMVIETPMQSKGQSTEKRMQKVELKRETSGSWQVLAGGTNYPADGTRVENLLSDLSSMRTVRMVTRKPKLYANFHLDKQNASLLTVTSLGGSKIALYYGKVTVSGGYIRVGTDPTVYVADQSLQTYLSGGASDWYNLRLLPSSLTDSKVQSIEIDFMKSATKAQRGLAKLTGTKDPQLPESTRTKGYRLVRRATQNNPNHWIYEADQSIKLDQSQVESLAREIVTLNGRSFYSGNFGADKSGTSTPGATVKISTSDGSLYTFALGSAAGKNSFYVKPEGPGVFTHGAAKSSYIYIVSRYYLERVFGPLDNMVQKPSASKKK